MTSPLIPKFDENHEGTYAGQFNEFARNLGLKGSDGEEDLTLSEEEAKLLYQPASSFFTTKSGKDRQEKFISQIDRINTSLWKFNNPAITDAGISEPINQERENIQSDWSIEALKEYQELKEAYESAQNNLLYSVPEFSRLAVIFLAATKKFQADPSIQKVQSLAKETEENEVLLQSADDQGSSTGVDFYERHKTILADLDGEFDGSQAEYDQITAKRSLEINHSENSGFAKRSNPGLDESRRILEEQTIPAIQVAIQAAEKRRPLLTPFFKTPVFGRIIKWFFKDREKKYSIESRLYNSLLQKKKEELRDLVYLQYERFSHDGGTSLLPDKNAKSFNDTIDKYLSGDIKILQSDQGEYDAYYNNNKDDIHEKGKNRYLLELGIEVNNKGKTAQHREYITEEGASNLRLEKINDLRGFGINQLLNSLALQGSSQMEGGTLQGLQAQTVQNGEASVKRAASGRLEEHHEQINGILSSILDGKASNYREKSTLDQHTYDNKVKQIQREVNKKGIGLHLTSDNKIAEVDKTKLKRFSELKYKYEKYFNYEALLADIEERIISPSLSDKNPRNLLKAHIRLFSSLFREEDNSAFKDTVENALSLVEKILNKELKRSDLGKKEQNGHYEKIDSLEAAFRKARRLQNNGITNFESFSEQFLTNLVGPIFASMIGNSYFEEKSDFVSVDKKIGGLEKEIEKIRLYFELLKTYNCKNYSNNYYAFAQEGQTILKQLFVDNEGNTRVGAEQNIKEEGEAENGEPTILKLVNCFKAVFLSQSDFNEVNKALDNYLEAYRGVSPEYGGVILRIGRIHAHQTSDKQRETLDPIVEYGKKRLTYLFNKMFENNKTEVLQTLLENKNDKELIDLFTDKKQLSATKTNKEELNSYFQNLLRIYIDEPVMLWNEADMAIIEKYGNAENKELYRVKGFVQYTESANKEQKISATKSEYINTLDAKGIKVQTLKKHTFVTTAKAKRRLGAHIQNIMPSENQYSLVRHNNSALVDRFAPDYKHDFRLDRLDVLIQKLISYDNVETMQTVNSFIEYYTAPGEKNGRSNQNSKNLYDNEEPYYQLKELENDQTTFDTEVDPRIRTYDWYAGLTEYLYPDYENDKLNANDKKKLANEKSVGNREKLTAIFKQAIKFEGPWRFTIQKLAHHFADPASEVKYFIKGLKEQLNNNGYDASLKWLLDLKGIGITREYINSAKFQGTWGKEISRIFREHIKNNGCHFNTYFLIDMIGAENESGAKLDRQFFMKYAIHNRLEGRENGGLISMKYEDLDGKKREFDEREELRQAVGQETKDGLKQLFGEEYVNNANINSNVSPVFDHKVNEEELEGEELEEPMSLARDLETCVNKLNVGVERELQEVDVGKFELSTIVGPFLGGLLDVVAKQTISPGAAGQWKRLRNIGDREKRVKVETKAFQQDLDSLITADTKAEKSNTITQDKALLTYLTYRSRHEALSHGEQKTQADRQKQEFQFEILTNFEQLIPQAMAKALVASTGHFESHHTQDWEVYRKYRSEVSGEDHRARSERVLKGLHKEIIEKAGEKSEARFSKYWEKVALQYVAKQYLDEKIDDSENISEEIEKKAKSIIILLTSKGASSILSSLLSLSFSGIVDGLKTPKFRDRLLSQITDEQIRQEYPKAIEEYKDRLIQSLARNNGNTSEEEKALRQKEQLNIQFDELQHIILYEEAREIVSQEICKEGYKVSQDNEIKEFDLAQKYQITSDRVKTVPYKQAIEAMKKRSSTETPPTEQEIRTKIARDLEILDENGDIKPKKVVNILYKRRMAFTADKEVALSEEDFASVIPQLKRSNNYAPYLEKVKKEEKESGEQIVKRLKEIFAAEKISGWIPAPGGKEVNEVKFTNYLQPEHRTLLDDLHENRKNITESLGRLLDSLDALENGSIKSLGNPQELGQLKPFFEAYPAYKEIVFKRIDAIISAIQDSDTDGKKRLAGFTFSGGDNKNYTSETLCDALRSLKILITSGYQQPNPQKQKFVRSAGIRQYGSLLVVNSEGYQSKYTIIQNQYKNLVLLLERWNAGELGTDPKVFDNVLIKFFKVALDQKAKEYVIKLLKLLEKQTPNIQTYFFQRVGARAALLILEGKPGVKAAEKLLQDLPKMVLFHNFISEWKKGNNLPLGGLTDRSAYGEDLIKAVIENQEFGSRTTYWKQQAGELFAAYRERQVPSLEDLGKFVEICCPTVSDVTKYYSDLKMTSHWLNNDIIGMLVTQDISSISRVLRDQYSSIKKSQPFLTQNDCAQITANIKNKFNLIINKIINSPNPLTDQEKTFVREAGKWLMLLNPEREGFYSTYKNVFNEFNKLFNKLLDQIEQQPTDLMQDYEKLEKLSVFLAYFGKISDSDSNIKNKASEFKEQIKNNLLYRLSTTKETMKKLPMGSESLREQLRRPISKVEAIVKAISKNAVIDIIYNDMERFIGTLRDEPLDKEGAIKNNISLQLDLMDLFRELGSGRESDLNEMDLLLQSESDPTGNKTTVGYIKKLLRDRLQFNPKAITSNIPRQRAATEILAHQPKVQGLATFLLGRGKFLTPASLFGTSSPDRKTKGKGSNGPERAETMPNISLKGLALSASEEEG